MKIKKRGGVFHRVFHHDFSGARKVILVSKMDIHKKKKEQNQNAHGRNKSKKDGHTNLNHRALPGLPPHFGKVIVVSFVHKFIFLLKFGFFYLLFVCFGFRSWKL